MSNWDRTGGNRSNFEERFFRTGLLYSSIDNLMDDFLYSQRQLVKHSENKASALVNTECSTAMRGGRDKLMPWCMRAGWHDG